MPFIDFDPMPPRGHPAPVLWLRDHLDPALFPAGMTDEEMLRVALRAWSLRAAGQFLARARELRLPWRLRLRIFVHRARLFFNRVIG
jgi:hypothetical protein